MNRRQSARKYREILERQKQQPVEVESPTGMIWLLQPINLQSYLLSGRLPQTLLEQFLKSAEASGLMTGSGFNFTSAQAVDALNFMRRLVMEVAVSPRIVETVTNEEDEIAISELDGGDLQFIVGWALSYSGVKGAEALATFRAGRSADVGAGADRPALRDAAIDTAGDSEPGDGAGLRSNGGAEADAVRHEDAGSVGQ